MGSAVYEPARALPGLPRVVATPFMASNGLGYRWQNWHSRKVLHLLSLNWIPLSRSSNVSEPQVVLPLQDKRVLVTRTREQAGVLSARLRELGATPVEFPTIRIVPPSDWGPLDTALRRLFHTAGGEATLAYDWVIFTSVNGVSICMNRV